MESDGDFKHGSMDIEMLCVICILYEVMLWVYFFFKFLCTMHVCKSACSYVLINTDAIETRNGYQILGDEVNCELPDLGHLQEQYIFWTDQLSFHPRWLSLRKNKFKHLLLNIYTNKIKFQIYIRSKTSLKIVCLFTVLGESVFGVLR